MEGAGHTAMQYHAESTDLFSCLEASSLAIFRACSVLSDMAVVVQGNARVIVVWGINYYVCIADIAGSDVGG